MPRPPRFFIFPDQASGPSIVITGEDVRHIATVLRMKPGEELLLCDGLGTEYSAKITKIERSAISTEIIGRAKRKLSFPRIILGQGIPKSDKMDLVVQKATELGVASIIPLVTERTVLKLRDEEKRVSRWQKICREAAMQSNRPDIPNVGQIVSFRDFLQTPRSEPALLLFPWEEGTEPITKVLGNQAGVKQILVSIGPEGGFSPKEAALAQEQGFHAVSLGPNILRTETAAIAVLGMIQYAFMEFKGSE